MKIYLVVLFSCVCITTQDLVSNDGSLLKFQPFKEGASVTCLDYNSQIWLKDWKGQISCLQLVHWKKVDGVLVYFDENVDRSNSWKEVKTANDHHLTYHGEAQWIFNFTSTVWHYITKSYENFGEDPRLYLCIHGYKITNLYQIPQLNNYSFEALTENVDNYRHYLDLSSVAQNAWVSNHTRDSEMDFIINKIFNLVENKFKGCLGLPSSDLEKYNSSLYSAWTDAFTIQIYLKINMTAQAQRYFKNGILKDETNTENTQFQNRFFPIHTSNDECKQSLVPPYFQVFQNDVRTNNAAHPNGNLNLGEFVLIWSGATQTDLRQLAHEAIGWDDTYQTQFENATHKFPKLARLFNKTDFDFPTKESTPPIMANTTEQSVTSNFNFTKKFITSTPLDIGEKPIETEATKKPEAKEVPIYFIIGGSVSGFIIVILVLGLVLSFIVYKRKLDDLQTEIRALTTDEVKAFFEGDTNVKDENDTQELVQYMPFVRDFEVTRDQLTVGTGVKIEKKEETTYLQDKIIGSGQFGRVMNGFLRNIDGIEVTPVAVKTVKANVEVVHFKAMLLEAKVMAYLGRHHNIVKLLGTYTANIKNREIFLALELCPLGDLHKFLKKNGHTYQDVFTTAMEPTLESATRETNVDEYSALNQISTLNLVTWAQEISSGMMYLTEKKILAIINKTQKQHKEYIVIHGDLAARNVLLTSNRIANISDFGLSRQLLNYANYKKMSECPLPWRWMAVESLNDMKFSVASDVWAFGVTLWEIFSMSKVPYPCWKWDYAFVDRLISGERLPKPQYANQKIYELMKDCWKVEPNERPTFHKINSVLGDIISFVGKAQVCQAEAVERKWE